MLMRYNYNLFYCQQTYKEHHPKMDDALKVHERDEEII